MALVTKVRSYIAGWLTLGILGAVVLVGISVWQVFDHLGVSTEPVLVQHDAIPQLAEGEKVYVRIEGGLYDEDNAYEYSTIETSKSGREKTTKVESFLPFVKEAKDDEIAFLVSFDNKYEQHESFADDLTLGLLRNADDLPDKIRNVMVEHYGHSNFMVLQSDYEAKSLLEQLTETLGFLALLIVIIGLRWLIVPKADAV